MYNTEKFKIVFPDYCCKCLKPSPDKKLYIMGGRGDYHQNVSWTTKVPLCKNCYDPYKVKVKSLLIFTLSLVVLMASPYLIFKYFLPNTEESYLAPIYIILIGDETNRGQS